MTTIVHDLLEHRGSDAVAFHIGDREVTYRRLVDRAARYAGGYEQAGVQPGSGVLVASTSLVELAAATFGGWWHGVRVAVIRGDASIEAKQRAARIAGVAVQLWDDLPARDPAGDGAARGAADPAAPIVRLADMVGPATTRPPACTPADVLHETFTSGTTGAPKCVSRSMGALRADVAALTDVMRLAPGDRVTAAIPALSSISVLPALQAGATVVMVPTTTPGALHATLSEQPISALVATPYIFELLARLGRPLALPQARLVITTSAHLRPSTAETFRELTGWAPRNVLCTSEAGHVTFNDADADDAARLLGSVGRLIPGVEVEIAPVEDGDPPPAPGEPGRIVVRSPHTAAGYRGGPQDGVFVDGAVRTSDLGYFDGDGYLFLTGRCDDRMKVGELIVHPWAVEERLLAHPGVSDAVVVPVDHPRLGQVPHARVVCEPGVTDEDLVRFCHATLDRDAVPRRFHRVASVPHDSKGQVVRTA